ncbi:MAG: hypothetical protein WBG92_06360 [Thiohalocapsa sp.]
MTTRYELDPGIDETLQALIQRAYAMQSAIEQLMMATERFNATRPALEQIEPDPGSKLRAITDSLDALISGEASEEATLEAESRIAIEARSLWDIRPILALREYSRLD